MARVKNDYHAGAAIALNEFEGVPVLIHQGGRYPALETDEGERIERYIDVALYQTTWTVTARADRDNVLRVGEVETLDDAAALYPAAVQAIADAPRQYAEYRSLMQRCGCGQGPLTRADYEALIAEFGLPPASDDDLAASYGAQYGDYTFPHYPLADLPRLWLDQRRCWGALKERKGAQQAARRTVAETNAATIAALRLRPVARTYTTLVPNGAAGEFLRDGALHSVVASKQCGTISADHPAVYGSHLLGHEGEPGKIVTIEVRE